MHFCAKSDRGVAAQGKNLACLTLGPDEPVSGIFAIGMGSTGTWRGTLRKEAGTSAGILALIALIYRSQFPGAREAASHDRSPAGQAEKASKQQHQQGAERREGPWIATRAFFGVGEAPPPPSEPAGRESPCGKED